MGDDYLHTILVVGATAVIRYARTNTAGLCASSSAKRGGRSGWLSGFAELILLVLLQVLHVEVAVSFEPVLMCFHGQRPHQPAA